MLRATPVTLKERRITSLTASQEAEFPRFVQKWIEIAMSTEPADRPRAEDACKRFYVDAGLREPQVIWQPCPISAAITASWYSAMLAQERIPLLTEHRSHRSFDESPATILKQGFLRDVDASSVDRILESACKAIAAARENAEYRTIPATPRDHTVANQIRASILDKLDASVHKVVQMAVNNAIRTSVELAVDRSIAQAIRESVRSTVDCAHVEMAWFSGAISPGFASWADYLHEICGVSFNYSFLDLTKNCGQFWALDGACIISERPCELHRDNRGRLHDVHGMAISYPSGWGLYRWHGFKVPRSLLQHPERITVARIDSEQNVEIRRAMIELYGMTRYFVESGGRVISHDAAGILYRKRQSHDEPIVMVRVLNSTPEPDGIMTREEAIQIFGEAAKAAVNAPEGARFKEYMIRVPPMMATARQAVAWTFGLEYEDFAPILES